MNDCPSFDIYIKILKKTPTSPLTKINQTVTTKYTIDQKVRYDPIDKNPTSLGSVLKYLLLKSAELNAENTVNDKKYPEFNPIVCAVDA